MERAAQASFSVDVVHQHGIWTAISRATQLLRRRFGIPTVIAPHGSLEPWALERSRTKKTIALALYERENLARADCLHAVSEYEIPSFRSFGLTNPIAVIPNAISTGWIDSTGDSLAFRQAYSIDEGHRILLFLSRITPVKGLPLLLEAVARVRGEIPDWRLVIVGGEELGHLSMLYKMITELGLGNMVSFTGALFGQAKRDAFAAAEVFVLPTRRDAAPIAVLEALGAGVPVITTKGAPWNDLVTHQCGWWVEPSADGLSRALVEALALDLRTLSRMGAQGRELVRNKYTWSKSSDMSLALYSWLLHQSPKPDFVV